MYDYYMGTLEKIIENEAEYLISIKRLLPKWLNGIPDCEFLALFKITETLAEETKLKGRKLVIAETGVGASTIVFIYSALKHGGHVYTWDLNPEKASQIRGVCVETLGQMFHKEMSSSWHLIPYDSVSNELGLPILKGMVDHIDCFFHDGDHVWNTIIKELNAVDFLLGDGSVVAIDDAQYDFIHTNEFIVNVLRRKMGLSDVKFEDNRGTPFYRAAEEYLEKHWKKLENLASSYRHSYRDDLFFKYYDADMGTRRSLGSDRFANQEHRFEAWRVSGRVKK
ncbi:MAG: class I SAM-dependent methyltransferase [Chlamydiae bacterium]|nr:class I SAM-dependent methyltransferase [Chlamydiota bacterium]MBI3276222.1 class I SAM-dependent methyltransferase [Chlamydiota bacterium]